MDRLQPEQNRVASVLGRYILLSYRQSKNVSFQTVHLQSTTNDKSLISPLLHLLY
jgi:hypothetical protein